MEHERAEERSQVRFDAPLRQAVGGYFRLVATNAGLRGHALAERLGWDPSKVSRVYSGELIKERAYIQVARALSLSWDETRARARELARHLDQGESTMDRDTKIITICVEKGGVGKTTMATALATSLELMGKRVLLVDLDAQANSTAMMLGEYDEDGEGAALLRALEGEGRPDVMETSYGVDVVPSGRKMSRAHSMLKDMTGGGFLQVERMLSTFRGTYDYIIIDTPPALGPLTGAALFAADHVLLPVKPDGFSIDAIHRTLRLCHELQETLRADFVITGCVILGYNNTIITREAMRELRGVEGLHILDIHLPHSTVFPESNFARIPLPHHAPGHKATRKLGALTRHLDALWSGPSLVEEVGT